MFTTKIKSKQAVEKPESRLFKKGPEARCATYRRAEAYLLIRWSEGIERNEAGGPFSTACLLLISIERSQAFKPLMIDQRWPRALLESIDLINSLVVGISGGETLSARKPISRIGARPLAEKTG